MRNNSGFGVRGSGFGCFFPSPESRVSSPEKGFTLVELLIAISLAGMIVLAVVSLLVSAVKFLTSANWESRVQNEAFSAVERIVKDISRGRRSLNCPAVAQSSNSEIVIRKSLDNNNDCNDDIKNKYEFINRTIEYNTFTPGPGWGTPLILAKNISGCRFIIDTAYNEAGSFEFTTVAITLTARRDAVASSTVTPNPTVVLETSAAAY